MSKQIRYIGPNLAYDPDNCLDVIERFDYLLLLNNDQFSPDVLPLRVNICFLILVPHRGTIVTGEIFIFDFLAYKHVLRPQEAKKPVFKKSLYVCVCVYVRTYVH